MKNSMTPYLVTICADVMETQDQWLSLAAEDVKPGFG